MIDEWVDRWMIAGWMGDIWMGGWMVGERLDDGWKDDGWMGRWMMGGRMHASMGGEMNKIIIDSVPIGGRAPSPPLPFAMLITVL